MSKILDKNDHGVAQLIASENQWALDLWKKGCANNWMPQAVDMSNDIRQWKAGDVLSDDERLLVKRTLGLFAAGESLVANSVDVVEWNYITDGACRQYLMRKQYEESLHNMTIAVCCEAYDLDVDEVAEAYKNIPSIKTKERYLMKSLDSFDPKKFDITTRDGKQKFLKNLVVFYLVCEGTWFFSNFALILSLGRQNKLSGLCDQILYTMRDETLHVEFGIDAIQTIKQDYPTVWTKKFQDELIEIIKEGVEVECEYAEDILPNGLLGVNANMLKEYAKYLADIRIQAVDLEPQYNVVNNPFPWLVEMQETQGVAAFFERREKSYQNAGSLDDDL